MRDTAALSVILLARGQDTSFHTLLRSLARQSSELRRIQILAARAADDPAFSGGLTRWSAILPCRDFVFLESAATDPMSLANEAAARADGRCLLFLDPGQRLLPDYLQTCLAALDQGADAVYTDRIQANGKVLACRLLPDFQPDVLRTGNPLGRTLLLRRELFEENGGLCGRSGLGHWEMWLRATQRGRSLVRAPRPLLCRQDNGSAQEPATGRNEALLVVRNQGFFPSLVLRWALALLRGESWALPIGPGRVPNELQARLLLENAAARRAPDQAAPAAEALPWDRFLDRRLVSA